MQGFTYNGIHSSALGVYYVPDASARGDFFSDYDVLGAERSWVDGGIYYKSRIKSRTFDLACYYETVTREVREKIISWVDRRTSGELIFDDRPYAKYFVRPTKIANVKDYLQMTYDNVERFSGTFTVTFTAYYPFAELTQTTITGSDSAQFLAEVNAIQSSMMPPAVTTSSTSCFIYNPGTETGQSIVRFAGSTGSSDFTIFNTTNGDKFTLMAGLSTAQNEYIEISSKTGKIIRHGTDYDLVDFSFHDDGYITFDPSEKPYMNVSVTKTSGSRNITSSGLFTNEMIKQYVYLENTWKQIVDVTDASHAIVNTNNASSGTVTTNIVSMNYVTIQKAENASISRLEIVCCPEVR